MAPTPHEGEHVESHATVPEEPAARLAHFSGDVVRVRGAAELRAGLDPGDGVIVRGEGSADVDLADGGRVTLGPDTEIRIGEGAAQVLLLRGELSALVPPGAGGTRPPLRIATPAASADLGGSGEMFVIAHASGAAWVASLAGLAGVASGEVDSRRRLRTVELPPGRALLAGARMAEPTDGPARLDAARILAHAALEGAAPLEADRMARDLADTARRLDESLSWLEAEARHGRDLTAQHREAVHEGRSDDAMRIQRELVTHAQQLYILRQVSSARWDRVLCQSLALSRMPGAPESTLATSRRDRVQSLLGD